jgi:hypothetical protein
MVPTEQKKLATLQEKSDTLGLEMEEAQQKASQAMRAEDKAKPSAPVQRLINKGFKAEFFAFKAADAVRDFKEMMRTKYLK